MILVVRTQVKSIAYLALKIRGCHGTRACNLRNVVITVCTMLEPTIISGLCSILLPKVARVHRDKGTCTSSRKV